jgi:hypothetical protein
MVAPRQRLNYSVGTVVTLLLCGAAASTLVGIFSTPTSRPIAFAWVFLALVGLVFSGLAIRLGRQDLDFLARHGVSGLSTGFDLATLVFKRAHVRSMVLYAVAHATLLQVGVVGIVTQVWFPSAQLQPWFRIYSTASLLFALFTLSLNLVLDSTVHARMREAERTEPT